MGTKKLLSSSLIYAGTAFANAAMPFFLLPILTRYLEPSEYGIVALFTVFITGFAALVGLSVEGAAIRKYYDSDTDDSDMACFIGACVQIMLVVSGCLLVSVIVILQLVDFDPGISVTWLLLAILVAGCAFLFQLALGQLQVRRKALFYGLFQIAMSLANLVLSLVLVIYFDLGAEGRMTAIAVSTALFSGISLVALHNLGLLSFRYRQGYHVEALRFGVPLIAHALGTFLVTMADRYLVGNLIGLDELGIYMVAAQTASILGILFSAINNAIVPWLFERLSRDDNAEKREIVKLTYFYFLFTVLLGVLTASAAPHFIAVFAGEKFQEAREIAGWLVFSQVFIGMYYTVVNYQLYAKKTVVLGATTLASGGLNIVLIFLFYEKYSILGVAYASVMTMILRFLATWWFSALSHPMPWFLQRESN